MITTFDLRQLRLSKGLPQDIIGNRKSIGKIEKGLTMPGPKLTRRMAQVERRDHNEGVLIGCYGPQ